MCPGGGIGRHKGLKIPRRKLRAGSSPAPGTNNDSLLNFLGMSSYKEVKKILLIPDSVWGNDSGHRSTQFLIKALKNSGYELGVFAEDKGDFHLQKKELEKELNVFFYKKVPYSFLDQFYILNKKARREFDSVVKDFQPDLVFYFGTIRNKVSIDFISSKKNKIPYIYLPLTNEFWCLKNFAGLKSGECFKCMNHNFYHAWVQGCSEEKSFFWFIKESIERIYSKNRFLNANSVLGYSESQVETFIKFGLPKEKTATTNIFFERKDLEKFDPKKGDYFVIFGQMNIAKGWHYVPTIIKTMMQKNIKFKLIIYNKSKAENFIKQNSLESFIENGNLEIFSGLESHEDVLQIVSQSLAVIIPSNYPSTGEFTLLESLGLKKPVLGFDVGAHKSFLKDRNNALISNVTDLEKMKRDILELNQDTLLWEKISSNAYKTFERLTDFNKKEESLISNINL